MIYFVIGTSGSGKTACRERLKKCLPNCDIHNFDDIGVPAGADKQWRQETTERWVKQLAEQPLSQSILLGQMTPGEIIACPSSSLLEAINIIVLDCSDEVRVKRLQSRPNFIVNQDTLNWASWLRMHCHDPQWQQHVILQDSAAVMQFDRWVDEKSWPPSVHIDTIDTTNLSIGEVVHSIKQCIAPCSLSEDNIVFSDTPNANEINFITKKINEETLDYGSVTPFSFIIKNEQQHVIAGVNGCLLYGAIYTDQLWVDKHYRKKSLASQLMGKVHEYGKASRCQIATLCSMSFQGAVQFYEKLGYYIDLDRAGYINGSHCVFLSKEL
jgi:GNAT superfamily N-acetyltransferase